MKKLLFVAILAVAGIAAAVAQPRAIGLNLGTGNGISYQHSLGEANMLDVAVNIPLQLGGESLGFGIGGIVTYDWINPFGTAIPWNNKGEWNWYLGVGAGAGVYNPFSTVDVPKVENGVEVVDKEGNIVTKKEWVGSIYAGIAGHVGVAYNFWFPLQLSLDIRPTIGVDNTKDNKVGFGLAGLYNVSLGVRYLF